MKSGHFKRPRGPRGSGRAVLLALGGLALLLAAASLTRGRGGRSSGSGVGSGSGAAVALITRERFAPAATAAAAAAARPQSSAHTSRRIVAAVGPALAAELRAAGVAAAAVVGCRHNSSVATDLAAAGLVTRCVARLADLQPPPRPPGRAAVVLVRLAPPNATDGDASLLLVAQLLAVADGGGGGGGGGDSAALAVVTLEARESNRVARASLARPPGWPGAGTRQVFTAATRIYLDAFNEVYSKKLWTADGGGSGQGSTLPYTAEVRKALPEVIRSYKISSMLDSSCGSMHWMPLVLAEVEKEQPGFRFYGSDVVCPLIEQHKTTFANRTNWEFGCLDYANQPLPRGYDLIWSRDSLQHVPFHAAWQFLNNVKATGAKYLLVGSYLQYKNANRDIKAGEYYAINIQEPPFNLKPKPLEVIDEHSEVAENNTNAMRKYMLLYEVDKLEWDDDLTDLI